MLALISFDAVSRPLLDRMMAGGLLPHCAALLRRGKTYALESTPLHASVYRSLYSGFSLSTHGVYYPFVWNAAEQRVKPAGLLNHHDSVFARLDRAGKRVLVIDPPECGRIEPRSGIAFCGWQFTSRFVLPQWYSSDRIARLLNERFGAPEGCNEVFGRQSATRLRAMRTVLQTASQRVADATAACLREGEFDLLWVTFVAPHIAGHHLWRESPDSKPDGGCEESGALEGIYRKADDALGRILAALPSGSDVILLSLNGMGAETSRADLLPAMLASVLQRDSTRRTAPRASGGLWRLRATVPTLLRARIADAIPESLTRRLTARLENTGTNRKKARAFALPSDGPGFVRLNLKGRERHGIVDPGDAERLLDEIAGGLATFVEPSGEKVIHSFLRASDLDLPGPKSSSLPDLVVEWSRKPEAALRRVVSPRFGEVLRKGVGSGRSGNHCEGGWACIAADGLRPSIPEAGPVRAIDLTATVCALMGVPCEDLQGRSLLATGRHSSSAFERATSP